MHELRGLKGTLGGPLQPAVTEERSDPRVVARFRE
jgi:hypothetical protein